MCSKIVIDHDAMRLLYKVGLLIHPDKSVLFKHIITFLGFDLNSILMQVSLISERVLKLRHACENLLASSLPSIRMVTRVSGLMTSSFPGVMYGPLHYTSLEMDKTHALKYTKGILIRTWAYPKKP